MINKNIKIITIMQIALLVGMTFSYLYFIDKTNPVEIEEDSLLNEIISFFNIIPTVSALEASDLQQGVATCVKTKKGTFCQEFPTSECAAQCDGACVPSSKDNVQQCKIGTCYASIQGSCQFGAPKITCELGGGQWFDSLNGNIPQCKRGCCIAGQQSSFTTSQECTALSSRLGTAKVFKSEITTELACLALSGGSTEGACVIEKGGENTCRFTTKADCTKLRGEFHTGYLCSASQLKTNCLKQATSKCLEGKDEIYWFDSCGNKENIYSANKDQSWNGGKILTKEQSCSLASGNNLDANQKTCGNCNYLLGTRCGAKTTTQKLSDNTMNYVCRDLSCVDNEGKGRKNGESWCTYQSSIGVDKGRSTDAVGSRHFRKICINGEVKTEPCQDFRNGICIESKDSTVEGGFSSAACRLNSWQECIDYNFKNETNKCLKNTDCFLKEVKVSKDYNFKVCAPKYNPGFDLSKRAEGAEAICSIASQKCKVVYQKGLSGWKCVKNCECLQKEFGEQLNNLCMSLGDCGAKVNYAGKVTENYRVSNSLRLNGAYISEITRYKDPVLGKVVEPSNISQLIESGALGLPSEIGAPEIEGNDAALNFALYTGGAIGTVLVVASHVAAKSTFVQGSSFVLGKVPLVKSLLAKSTGTGVGATSAGTTAAGGSAATSSSAAGLPDSFARMIAAKSGSSGAAASSTAPPATASLAPYGGAFAGAAIGLALTSLLLKMTGVGSALPSGLTYALLAAGTTAGLIAGWTAAGGSASTFSALGFLANPGWLGIPVLGWIVVGVVVALKVLGIGKTKEVIVEFQCQPWQAPIGGADCSQCGKGGVSCSRYSCQALGQTCQLVNEGTEAESCTNIAPQDVSAPIIKPWEGALLQGYSYNSVSDGGYTVKGSQECIPAYTNIKFGIELNELGQCKFDTIHTDSYKDMEFSFGGRNLYLQNHSMTLSLPSLESLGLIDINPASKVDYSFYVRCQDKSGNANIREYAINLCISQGNDVTPPIVLRGAPAGDDVAYGAIEENITVFVNEPANCRISDADTVYSNMPTNMNCFNSATDQSAFGFACSTTVQLPQNISTFYIRCADQPWLNETDYALGKRNNENTQSLVISLKKSLRQLKIDSLQPDNTTIISSIFPASIELLAKTSGGLDGKAICSVNVSGNWLQFFETDATQHRQVFNQMSGGNKTAQVRCLDRVGNTAERTSKFNVIIDNTIPAITRVYADQSTLVVVTDESGECAYSHRSCEFEFDEGTRMSGIDKIHSAVLDNNKNYYILCKDKLGNKPDQCQITVREGKIV